MTKSLALMICYATLCTSAFAQAGAIDLFQYDRTYVGLGNPRVEKAPAYYDLKNDSPPLLAEAQFLARFPLYRGMKAATLIAGTGHGFNLFLTSQIRLRGLDVQSGPVRSLSFMPRFVGQYLWTQPLKRNNQLRIVQGITGVIGHHSNGGDGCNFADETPDTAGKCQSSLPPNTPSADRVYKVTNGNFATNYVELGYSARFAKVLDDPRDRWEWAIESSLTFQYNHTIPLPLPADGATAFANLYGRSHPRLEIVAHKLLFKRFAPEIQLRGEVFKPKEERFPESSNTRLDGLLLLHFSPNREASPTWMKLLSLVAVGARHYQGMDYYNTQFVRDIKFTQFQISIDPWTAWIEK